MTLGDEDTNSILTDDANRAILHNVTMQVTPPGDQICNLYKWRHLVTKLSGALYLMAKFVLIGQSAKWQCK